MNNYQEVILDNGLRMYLLQDKTKNRCRATLYTLAGGKDKTFYVDDKKVNVPAGCAHFLEHYLIEHSIYGNALEMFFNNYIESNGATNAFDTYYYISTVHDFKDLYVKLLNIVNNPVFDEQSVEDTKKPIISEINRENDKKYLGYNKLLNRCVYNNPIGHITLGEKEDIINMSVDDLKLFHDSFYRSDNQIIVITGNFDDDIVELTKQTYDSFKHIDTKVRKEELHEDVKVKEAKGIYDGDIKDPMFDIAFKFDISNLAPVEKNKLDFYLSYLYTSNFGMESDLYSKLINEKLITFTFDFDISIFEKNLLVVYLSNSTPNFDEVSKLMIERFKSPIFDEESFARWKNNVIINRINSLEKIGFKEKNFSANLFQYDYKEIDSLDFIKALNLDECKKMLGALDYSNYTIVKNNAN